MSRREQIQMSAAEVAAFLAEERTVTCATVGPRGWYVLRGHSASELGPRIWSWTYAASQKVRNLERDPSATLQVETGESYEELRGVMLECDVIVHRDLETVAPLGGEILLRNSVPRDTDPPTQLPDEVRAMIDQQAPKRVGLEFVERRRATWDHRKLGGAY
jgi:hypothetical protein